MNKLVSRIKKIEESVNTKNDGLMVFVGEDEEAFKRQKDDYLKNGGDPDTLFIFVKDFSTPTEPC